MPTSPSQATASKRLLAAAFAAIFGLTGCSDHPPRRGPDAEQMEPAAPSMSAQDTYFGGTLLVEANLGRGFNGGRGGGPGGPRGGPGGGGHHGGGMHGGFGGGGPGGGSGMGGPGGGGMGGPPGGGEMGGPGPGGGFGGGPTIRESNMPPIALRLRLTNKSKETVEVTFMLCKSELGDFAVRPEKLALAPDQTAEPDPMTSRLGLPSDELVLRVSLKVNGKVEQKDLVLREIPKAEPAPDAKP